MTRYHFCSTTNVSARQRELKGRNENRSQETPEASEQRTAVPGTRENFFIYDNDDFCSDGTFCSHPFIFLRILCMAQGETTIAICMKNVSWRKYFEFFSARHGSMCKSNEQFKSPPTVHVNLALLLQYHLIASDLT
jgi:hypothetical protein